jgi:hypothetical protein
MSCKKIRVGDMMALAIMLAVLAGCSQLPEFPKLPIGDVIGQVTLTPAEQEAEIKELADAQVQNAAQASDAAESPQQIPASVSEPE